MKKVRIGLPDGNGCFGTLEFWKQYFSDIGVEILRK
jgi:predicted nucleotide-binding protein (sugar kinase/HSP70/actin superfamily)